MDGVRPAHPLLAVTAFVVALGVGGCASPTPDPEPDAPPGTALRVMTWNVETHAHDPAEWVDTIARLRPDVVALQEICAGEADELARLLGRDHGPAYRSLPGPIRPPTPDEAHAPVNEALGPVCGTGPDDVAYGLAVLTRLPSGTPTVATYPPDHRDEQRGFMTAPVTTASGTTVAVVDTHLGLDGVQTDQARRLAGSVPDEGPVVVLGDLNVGTDDPALAPLRARLTEVDPDGRLATTSFGTVDHVLVRGLAPAGPARVSETSASDHRPLVVDLRLAG